MADIEWPRENWGQTKNCARKLGARLQFHSATLQVGSAPGYSGNQSLRYWQNGFNLIKLQKYINYEWCDVDGLAKS